jgi:hypothetical protein
MSVWPLPTDSPKLVANMAVLHRLRKHRKRCLAEENAIQKAKIGNNAFILDASRE